MLTPAATFRKDKDAVFKLREAMGAPWFERAVHAALLTHHQRAKTTDEIHGAADFVACLSQLIEQEPAKPAKISSGINHEQIDEYASRRSSRSTKASSGPSPDSEADHAAANTAKKRT